MGLFDKYKKQKFTINNKNITLKYYKELNNTATFFIKILEDLDKEENVIQENHTIRIGYMLYKVVLEDNNYKLLTIDLSDKTLNTFTDDLSVSLNYLFRQSDIINKTKINGNQILDTYFDEDMIISKQTLNNKKLYMLREEKNGNDCGWYLGVVGEQKTNNPDDYVKIKTYRLKDICDVAIDVLQLPVGTLIIIDNNKIIDIVDKNNNKLI